MADDVFAARARTLDRDDPLAAWRDRLVPTRGDSIYLDGNSLGRPTRAGVDRLAAIAQEWALDLVAAWDGWIDLPFVVGDRIGSLLGAASNQIVVGDSTSVQLYKVLHAVARAVPQPTVLLAAGEFPTDRYVAAGVADALDGRLVKMRPLDDLDPDRFDAELASADADVAVVSMIDFVTGARQDVDAFGEVARRRHATIIWDLSHAAGVVPVELDAWGVEAAVGCTYKYLHGGPGSPAFAYVRTDRQQAWRQPIWGWWGQRDQFTMGERYDSDDRMRQFAVGTPPIVQLALVDEGVAFVESAGIAAIDAKRGALTHFAIDCIDGLLPSAHVVTPRDSVRRGGHVAIAHDEASRLTRAARDRGVVADFRQPDRLRLGLAPLSTSYTDVARAIKTYAELLEPGALDGYPNDPGRVT